MGWFEEQILQREISDQELFEDSLFHLASAVLGKRQAGYLNDERIITKEAIDEILKYYHLKPVEIPEEVRDPQDQLEFCLRPHGLMRRNVKLEEGWYRNAFGPILAFRKEDDAAVALLPRSYSGYCYHDYDSGEIRKINKETAAQFHPEAVCFYRPLPLTKLTINDLVIYMKDCLSSGDYIFLVVLTLAATLLGMMMTNITRALTGFVLESGNVSLLAGTAVFMLSAILSARLISASRELMVNRIVTKASLSVEAAMMMRVINMPANFFRRFSSGELYSRYNAISQLSTLLLGNVFSIGLGALFSLLYITQIFHYAAPLVVPAVLIILAGIVISLLSNLMQMRLSRQIMDKSSKESGLSFELITGIQKIRLAGAEKRAFAKWGHTYAGIAELTYNPPVLIRAYAAISGAVSLIGTIVLFYLAVQNEVTPSEYIAFNAAYGAVAASVASLTGVALSIARIRPILELAEPILKTEPESSGKKTMVTKLNGNIELSNVYFRYSPNMPYVINGMSLKISAGEYVALVGTTGCGKSTLVRLLLGFETPEKGAIFFDGKDAAGIEPRSLRRQIGSVTQDGKLFQGDIFSNISISAPQMTQEEAWEAAELAGVAEEIRAMPMGMQTMISEGQGGISGGQKQRLMIARAIAPKPKILIFDEATSALDNMTQKQVSEALDGLDCTRIVIAHRLSTVRNCSRILVMDKGKILEDGTYDELIAHNGLFAELMARQRLDT